jgi:hypothetical protein
MGIAFAVKKTKQENNMEKKV